MKIKILSIVILFTFLAARNHSLYFTFKDDDGKIIKGQPIKCTIKSPRGEFLEEINIKRVKNKTKFKYNFSNHRSKVRLTGNNNYYTFIFEWTDKNGVPHQNSLKVLRKWFEERYIARDGLSIKNDFKNYGNESRDIKLLANGVYNPGGSKGYRFEIPLYEKVSTIKGIVEDKNYNPIDGVKIKLDYNLRRVLDLKDMIITNYNGQFEINAKKKKGVTISKNRNYGIILTKKGYKPFYQKIIMDNIKSRDITDLGIIELSDNIYTKEEVICNKPRVWDKKCRECVCEKEDEIYYYKINECDIKCPDNKQTIITNNKVNCIEPPKLVDDINVIEFEPLDKRIVSIKFIDADKKPISNIEFTHNNKNSVYTTMNTNANGISTSSDEIIELCKKTMYNRSWSGCADDDRLCSLQSYMLDNDYLEDVNNNECYDSDEKLISIFNGYNIENMFYLSDYFLELESYVDTIDNIYYNNGNYSIYIDKNKIKMISQSEVLLLTYMFKNEEFKLYEVDYLDYIDSNDSLIANKDKTSNVDFVENDKELCVDDFNMLKKVNNNCNSNEGNLQPLIKILENNKCRTQILNNNYSNYIDLVEYLYDDVMMISEEDFLKMYYEKGPNSFEYLDLIFSNMNNLLISSNTSTQNIPDGNSNAYIANIYEKQIKFYYKYLEYLYVLDPEMYRIKFDYENQGRPSYKYNFNKGEDGLTINDEDFDIKCDIFQKIQLSLSNYDQYSEKAGILSQNNITRNNSIVKQYDRRMKWINAMYGNTNCQ